MESVDGISFQPQSRTFNVWRRVSLYWRFLSAIVRAISAFENLLRFDSGSLLIIVAQFLVFKTDYFCGNFNELFYFSGDFVIRLSRYVKYRFMDLPDFIGDCFRLLRLDEIPQN